MKPLSPSASMILRHLVTLLPKVVPGEPQTYTGYKEVHVALGWEKHGLDWGDSLKRYGLVELADWMQERGLPALTGIVVNQESFSPGGGFFKMHDRDPFDLDWWKSEIARAKAFDWSTLEL